jgi:chromosome segregation ATPase
VSESTDNTGAVADTTGDTAAQLQALREENAGYVEALQRANAQLAQASARILSLADDLDRALIESSELAAQRDSYAAQLEVFAHQRAPAIVEPVDLETVEVPADYVPTADEVAAAGLRNGMSDHAMRAACWIRRG